MIIKADKKDKDAIQKMCALSELVCEVYTIETNDQMCAYNITLPDCREIGPDYAWYLARTVQIEIEMEPLRKKI